MTSELARNLLRCGVQKCNSFAQFSFCTLDWQFLHSKDRNMSVLKTFLIPAYAPMTLPTTLPQGAVTASVKAAAKPTATSWRIAWGLALVASVALTAPVSANTIATPVAGSTANTPRALPDTLAMIAGCTGRLSAQMEHQWLMGRSGDGARDRRGAMLDILDAMITPETGRQVLARRIEAKYAQSRLLQRAEFNDDPTDAHRARTRAEIEIANCTALLLS